MNASNDIGVNKYGLQCMDGSVCKATFSRAERAKFLDKKIIEKLENLEQQDAIRLAAEHLQDFENCPYCDYGHICPPVEMDKEFRCEYPECQEVRHTTPILKSIITEPYRYLAGYASKSHISRCPVTNTKKRMASANVEPLRRLVQKRLFGRALSVQSEY